MGVLVVVTLVAVMAAAVVAAACTAAIDAEHRRLLGASESLRHRLRLLAAQQGR
jgi:hypothetical protein